MYIYIYIYIYICPALDWFEDGLRAGGPLDPAALMILINLFMCIYIYIHRGRDVHISINTYIYIYNCIYWLDIVEGRCPLGAQTLRLLRYLEVHY